MLNRLRAASHPHGEDFKLPNITSMAIMMTTNLLLQISFFIIISSSHEYAKHLGGNSTFSGIVIGIPTVFSGLALLPIMKFDHGGYSLPLHICCGASILGHILYALAYKAQYLYLILIGRIVSGLAFSMWMYCKRYCSDGRIVGIRQRTTLAGCLVLGQGLGMSAGPFFGGLLTKVGFSNDIFNGYTSPGWIMAIVWAAFWIWVCLGFEDVIVGEQPEPPDAQAPISVMGITDSVAYLETKAISLEELDSKFNGVFPVFTEVEPHEKMTAGRWGVVICMCWFAMTCFFILGAWESNIPVYSAGEEALKLSPFGAGNFIALGGITTLPFLMVNLLFVRRIQDRHILLVGSLVGLSGLVIFIALLASHKVNYVSMFACWWLVALGFNLASTVTVSLLSKQLPQAWNSRVSLAIQYSNYTGRVAGAIWGGSGSTVGMLNYAGLEIIIASIGAVFFTVFWRKLKTKTG